MKRAAVLVACLAIASIVVGEPLADAVTGPTLSLSESSAYEYAAGTTLYYAPTGSNSGSFTVTASASAGSGISSMDFPNVFGADGATDTTSPYSNAYSWTSSDSASGPYTVTATDGDADTATADFTLTPDTAAPSGHSVSLSGGPGYSTLSVPLAFDDGTDSGAGIDSASRVAERASATLSAGTCGSFGSFAPVTLVGTADTSVTSGNCYHYRYKVSDLVGNQSAVSATTADALVDAGVPTVTDTAPTELTGAGDQYWNSSTDTLWFRPAGAGSFTLNAAASDSASGIAQVDFPNVSAVTGWGGSNGGADTTAPYASPVAYAWTIGAAAPGPRPVTATTGTGGTASDTISISADSTAPAGQTVALTNGPWFSTSVSLALGAGTDAGAGVDSTRGIVERASARLTNGLCGTFGAFSAVTLSGSRDANVSSGNCYRYQYKATDLVGNVSSASAPSADAKIDTTAPSAPTLRVLGLSNSASVGNVLYYRPTGTGSFTVTAASSDTDSGIASYSFPSVPGFTVAGSGPSRQYSYTNAGLAPTGPLAVTATNGAGLTSAPASFRLAADTAAPTLTVRCNGKPCHGAVYAKVVTVTATATDGSGSGVDTIRYTMNGKDPTTSRGFEYQRNFSLRRLTHLRMRAYDKAGNASATVVLTIRSAADRLFFSAPPRLTAKSRARFLFAKVTSTRRAIASATMSGPRLKHPQRWRFILSAGTSIVKFRLPAGLPESGRYTVVWVVRVGTQKASKTTRVTLGTP